jgi:pteridine reductase
MAEKPWWVLVGGRRRLGRALAESLGRDHNLLLTSSRPWGDEDGWVADLAKQTKVRLFRWDADSPALQEEMMADLETLGTEGLNLECAVIVAGTFPREPLGTWEPSSLETTWRQNLTFPLLALQSLAPRLREGGCLQLILDTAIHRPFLERMPYCAAKAGLGALVPALARALGPGVRVVAHALGTCLPEEGCDPAALARLNLLGRNGEPEDLARALRYAAASPYLTGEILTLDGGRRWA